jgi:hypothetical protein
MAITGVKNFQAGAILTAADLNTYNRGVFVFANAAARTSAFSSAGITLTEGWFSYLTDTNSTEYYDGAAWVAASAVSSVFARTGAVVAGNADYLAVASGGLTGAVSATRYVGGTATVAPTTGTFAVGDFVISQNGAIWVCTVAGTPGTWVQANGTQPWTAQLSNLASFANLNWNTRTAFNANGGLSYVNSTGAQNAYMEWKVPLSAGTWTFGMNHYAGADRGIYTLTIDGGSSLGTIDGYAAGSAGTYSTITGIAVTSNTNALVRLTMATKNASSSAYGAYFVGATMQRTA